MTAAQQASRNPHDQHRGGALAPGSMSKQGTCQWQSFETVPAGDVRILAYFPRYRLDDDGEIDDSVDLGGVQAVTWRSGNGWIEPDYLDASGAWFGDDFCYASAPTFWMPLPADPAKAAA